MKQYDPANCHPTCKVECRQSLVLLDFGLYFRPLRPFVFRKINETYIQFPFVPKQAIGIA